MKPSQVTATTQNPIPNKPNSTTNPPGFLPPFYYEEPTSVLDNHHLNSSPNSSSAFSTAITITTKPAAHDYHNLLDVPAIDDEDWDPLTVPFLDSCNLDLDSLFPNLPPPSPPPPFDQTHLDHLIRAAHALESNDPDLALSILARLNPLLPAPSGRPLQRAAFYFKESLQALLTDSGDSILLRRPSAAEVVGKIAAYKALSDLSPIPLFATFTANQTILDAVLFPCYGATPPPIHIVDFDIGLGGQWSSFLHEIAARCRASRVNSPSVRITAIVTDDSLETSLMAENLRDFAGGLGLRFSIELVRVSGIGLASLGAVRFSGGESVAVSFTPAVFRLLGGGGAEEVTGFLRFLRRASPRVVVFVDAESWCPDSAPHHQSFRKSFVAGLEYYSVMLESLDSATVAVGLGDDQVGRIEKALIRPRILGSVRSWAVRALPWGQMLERAGLKPVPFSDITESHAEWLTQQFPAGGFRVARRDGSMVLNWQGRELAATSAWKC